MRYGLDGNNTSEETLDRKDGTGELFVFHAHNHAADQERTDNLLTLDGPLVPDLVTFGLQKLQTTGSEVHSGLSHRESLLGRSVLGLVFQMLQHLGQQVLNLGSHVGVSTLGLSFVQHTVFGQNIILRKLGRVGGTRNQHGGDHTGASKLFHCRNVLHDKLPLLGVGLDATDVTRLRFVQSLHEVSKLGLELSHDRIGGQVTLGTTGGGLLDRSGIFPNEVGTLVVVQVVGNDIVRACLGRRLQISRQRIGVADDEVLGLVNDGSGVVMDTELDTSKGTLLDQTRDGLVTLKGLADKGLVVTLGTNAFLVKLFDDSKLSFDQLKYIRVVIVFDIIKVQSFGLVLFLHGLEDISSKLLLKLFVTVVDTELFESIDGERFESENIQKSNKTVVDLLTTGVVIFGARRVVNGTDQPQEDLGVNLLGKGVGRLLGNIGFQRDLVFFTTGLDGTFGKGQFQQVQVTADQFRKLLEFRLGRNDGLFVVSGLGGKGQVTRLQDGSNGLE
mmetsp:Transcript_102334/g.153345  ORF Transcript_102334/g.153345 Transcript_102334/m.153345 type:complete len:502 (-) Transcript_102334:1311-2816(-)